MIELQPFVNVKNIKKTPAERQKVKDRDMKDDTQEVTDVKDTNSWRSRFLQDEDSKMITQYFQDS